MKLLEQTILELKGQEPQERPRATLNLRVDLRIPEGYVPEVHQRMALYKRVSQVRTVAEVDALRAEIRDRYGALPAEVDGLLTFAALRIRSEALGVQQADLGAVRRPPAPRPRHPARRRDAGPHPGRAPRRDR